ncbi:hypothetical protein [Corallococcus exercitus]|uniref:hypothetical protein n=1 Tax=Corallococcus exercitus TaxID=2316736 RepID=UPI0035D4874E
MAWTAPTLGLLLCAAPALARDPQIGRGDDTSPAYGSQNAERASTSPSNVVSTVPTTSPEMISPDMSARQFTPDPDRLLQVSGPVVKRSGMMLYVQDVTGPVVPLDMSALRIHRQPEKGQQVLALYQVEGGTNNMAVSLSGEVPR